MANPTLSHLLHADPAPQQQLHHPQHHHQHQPPQPGQSPTAGSSSSGLAPVSASFTYPPPPSTASPAASATPNPLATPAASPTAQHTPGSASGSASGSVPKSHANNTSLYQCADCLKRYSRPEHLQRHIATHTLGKRFVCDVSLYSILSPIDRLFTLYYSSAHIPVFRFAARLLGVRISSRDIEPTTMTTPMAQRGGESTRRQALGELPTRVKPVPKPASSARRSSHAQDAAIAICTASTRVPRPDPPPRCIFCTYLRRPTLAARPLRLLLLSLSPQWALCPTI